MNSVREVFHFLLGLLLLSTVLAASFFVLAIPFMAADRLLSWVFA